MSDYDDDLPPYSEPTTSLGAARRVRESSVVQRSKVYQFLVECGKDGETADGTHVRTGIPLNSLHARLWELEGKDRGRDIPKLITMTEKKKPTRTGTLARIYVADIYLEEEHANRP